MSRRLIGKSPKFEFGICLFESNRFKLYCLMVIYILVYFKFIYFIIINYKIPSTQYSPLKGLLKEYRRVVILLLI